MTQHDTRISSANDARRASGVETSMRSMASSSAWELTVRPPRSPWVSRIECTTSSWNSSWLSQIRRITEALVTRMPCVRLEVGEHPLERQVFGPRPQAFGEQHLAAGGQDEIVELLTRPAGLGAPPGTVRFCHAELGY